MVLNLLNCDEVPTHQMYKFYSLLPTSIEDDLVYALDQVQLTN